MGNADKNILLLDPQRVRHTSYDCSMATTDVFFFSTTCIYWELPAKFSLPFLKLTNITQITAVPHRMTAFTTVTNL